VEAARALGMDVIQFMSPTQLTDELRERDLIDR
jgi:hypothetical protein